MSNSPTPEVCSYEGSTYRTDFWEGKGRDYEDGAERLALAKLLPNHARRYIDIGGGFGRLVDMASAYDQVVLMDYSRTMLQDAQARLGRDGRILYVCADLYKLPFAANSFDAGIMCRVIHHMADPKAALEQIYGCFAPDSTFILEFANKLNLKAIGRFLLRRQTWNPFDRAQVEFVKLNFDFHPAAMGKHLRDVGFHPRKRLGVSWLRLGFLKRRAPLKALLAVEQALQPLGALVPYAPSMFLANHKAGQNGPLATPDSLFKCPLSGQPLRREGDVMVSDSGGYRWPIQDGIYNFKDPLS
jgi:SAM-dependent methyltransferase